MIKKITSKITQVPGTSYYCTFFLLCQTQGLSISLLYETEELGGERTTEDAEGQDEGLSGSERETTGH